jgi:predicted RNase H-like HicB family nuclease
VFSVVNLFTVPWERRGGGMKFKVILEPSEEGGFTVYVPSLPGCISEGDTQEDALKNIREAIELYLEPVDDDMFLTESKEMKEIVV